MMRKFSHDTGILMKCAIANDATLTMIDIQYRRKTEIDTAGIQFRCQNEANLRCQMPRTHGMAIP